MTQLVLDAELGGKDRYAECVRRHRNGGTDQIGNVALFPPVTPMRPVGAEQWLPWTFQLRVRMIARHAGTADETLVFVL